MGAYWHLASRAQVLLYAAIAIRTTEHAPRVVSVSSPRRSSPPHGDRQPRRCAVLAIERRRVTIASARDLNGMVAVAETTPLLVDRVPVLAQKAASACR